MNGIFISKLSYLIFGIIIYLNHNYFSLGIIYNLVAILTYFIISGKIIHYKEKSSWMTITNSIVLLLFVCASNILISRLFNSEIESLNFVFEIIFLYYPIFVLFLSFILSINIFDFNMIKPREIDFKSKLNMFNFFLLGLFSIIFFYSLNFPDLILYRYTHLAALIVYERTGKFSLANSSTTISNYYNVYNTNPVDTIFLMTIIEIFGISLDTMMLIFPIMSTVIHIATTRHILTILFTITNKNIHKNSNIYNSMILWLIFFQPVLLDRLSVYSASNLMIFIITAFFGQYLISIQNNNLKISHKLKNFVLDYIIIFSALSLSRTIGYVILIAISVDKFYNGKQYLKKSVNIEFLSIIIPFLNYMYLNDNIFRELERMANVNPYILITSIFIFGSVLSNFVVLKINEINLLPFKFMSSNFTIKFIPIFIFIFMLIYSTFTNSTTPNANLLEGISGILLILSYIWFLSSIIWVVSMVIKFKVEKNFIPKNILVSLSTVIVLLLVFFLSEQPNHVARFLYWFILPGITHYIKFDKKGIIRRYMYSFLIISIITTCSLSTIIDSPFNQTENENLEPFLMNASSIISEDYNSSQIILTSFDIASLLFIIEPFFMIDIPDEKTSRGSIYFEPFFSDENSSVYKLKELKVRFIIINYDWILEGFVAFNTGYPPVSKDIINKFLFNTDTVLIYERENYALIELI